MNTRKILKLFLTFATFVVYLYYVISDNNFTLIQIPTALSVASLVYLGCSLYGFALKVSRNYIIAAILSIGVIFLLIEPLDNLVLNSSWITNDIVLIVIMLITLFFIIRDIRSLVGKNENTEAELEIPAETVSQEPQTTSALEIILKDQKLMMRVSEDYEKRKGYKPTYEELVDFINNEYFHEKTYEEIQREIDERFNKN